ncbi:MAG UNVERIFIED_CONTAM: hypothetical protein LVQ98_08570 [Rickettsiaceae bacterium]
MALLKRNLKYPKGSLRNIMDGRSKNPGVNILILIAQKLGCSVDYILGLEESDEILDNVINYNLYKEVTEEILLYISQNGIRLSFKEFIRITKNIYSFCAGKNYSSFDKEQMKIEIETFRNSINN